MNACISRFTQREERPAGEFGLHAVVRDLVYKILYLLP
jgi:hypothetical protein